MAWFKRWWFVLGMLAALVVSRFLPGRPPGPMPEWPALIRDSLVFGIALLTGLSLPVRQALQALSAWPAHVLIQGMSFGLMPLVMFGIGTLVVRVGAPTYVGEGLILLGCLPTTVAGSIMFSRVAGEDGSLAAVNAVIGNLAGILVTPALMMLTTGRGDFAEQGALFLRLAMIIAAPMLVGMTLAAGLPRLATWIKPRATMAMQALLLGLVLLAFMLAAWRDVHVPVLELLVVVVLSGVLAIAALAMTDAIASWRTFGFSQPRRATIAIAGSQKTLAFGLPIIAIIYADTPSVALIILPLLAYHPLQLVVGSYYANRMAGSHQRQTEAE